MQNFDKYREILKTNDFNGQITENMAMSDFITMKVGGKARFFVKPCDINSLILCIKTAKECNVKYKILGNGSNVLVADSGFDGVIISMYGTLDKVQVDGDVITADAGALGSKVSACALENSLTGLEFLSGIPGSVGGAVFMNAGAYDGEMAFVVTKTTYLDENLNLCTMQGDEHKFAYRHSVFKDNRDYIIVCTQMKLKQGAHSEILEKMQDFSRRRRDKQPLNFPSSGSTFKRPPNHFAGALIEQSGLKGYRVGDAMVSEKHAGFVVNVGNATCHDVLSLIKYVQDTVMQNTGIKLECEVEILERVE